MPALGLHCSSAPLCRVAMEPKMNDKSPIGEVWKAVYAMPEFRRMMLDLASPDWREALRKVVTSHGWTLEEFISAPPVYLPPGTYC